ncbi:hypothetical protein ACP275_05G025400 [Erythranthe tilingii]
MALLNLIIDALCVAVLIQLASCSSDHVTHVQNVNYGVHQAKLTLHLLPRKLKLQEEPSSSVKSLGDNRVMPQEKSMEASSGKKENTKKEENVVNKKAGGKGASEYLTVDYNWVRRRRPIHNKQIPFLP